MKKALLFLLVMVALSLASCSEYSSRMSYEDLWYEVNYICEEYEYDSSLEDAMTSLSLFFDNDPYITRKEAKSAYEEINSFISAMQKDLWNLQRELEVNKP